MVAIDNKKGRRTLDEVMHDAIFDKDGKNDGCVNGHCVIRQLGVLRGMPRDMLDEVEQCYGAKAHDGCCVKLFLAKNELLTPFNLSFSKFIAQLKFEAGKAAGYDIDSRGARVIFEHNLLSYGFNEAFEDYMKRKIELRQVYARVMGGRDLREMVGALENLRRKAGVIGVSLDAIPSTSDNYIG